MPIDFVAVDFPQANRLTAHILAAMISARTKAALEAAKARGVQLCRQLDGSARGDAAKTAKADKRALILPMKEDGASLRQIADAARTVAASRPRAAGNGALSPSSGYWTGRSRTAPPPMPDIGRVTKAGKLSITAGRHKRQRRQSVARSFQTKCRTDLVIVLGMP
jgi:hypothetical protein